MTTQTFRSDYYRCYLKNCMATEFSSQKSNILSQMDSRHFSIVESSPSFLFAMTYGDDCMCRRSSNFVLGL